MVSNPSSQTRVQGEDRRVMEGLEWLSYEENLEDRILQHREGIGLVDV